MFEYRIERDHPFRSPKERLMSCDSPIAICGMNATCGIFIRMCAIFLLHSPTNHRFFWVHHLLTFSLFAIYGPTEALLNSLSHLKCQGGGA